MAEKVHTQKLTVNQLDANLSKAKDLLGQILALFPEALTIAGDDRRRSQGKLGLEESAALSSVVDGIDLRPAVFACLADEDEGNDPNKVETDLIRDRFHRHDVYAQFAEVLGDASTKFSDTALTFGALVKPVARAAYQIAKPISTRDAQLREKIAKALDYYAANAQAAADARQANKAAPK